MAEQAVDPPVQGVRRSALAAVVFALELYMEQDECVCDQDACPPGCDGCMYCIAQSALERIATEHTPTS